MECNTWASICLVAIACCGDGDELSCQAGKDSESPRRQPPWELMDFTDWPDEDRRVTSVKFLLRTYTFGEPQPPTVSVESKDPVVLRRMEEGLTYAWHNLPRRHVLASGGEPYGELIVTTNQESFTVFLYRRFVLENPYENSNNGFQSWILAKTIDDLLFLETKRHLEPSKFEALSGERMIEGAKAAYRRIGDEAEKKD